MGHGLRHPADLVAWRRWHESRHPVRGAARSAARAAAAPRGHAGRPPLTRAGRRPAGGGRGHARQRRAGRRRTARPPRARPHDDRRPRRLAAARRRTPPTVAAPSRSSDLADLVTPRAVLAAGHYTEIGAAAFAVADDRELPFLVSQHGALTPYAPPLPRAARLLAWSEADGAFWTAGRQDVEVDGGRQPAAVGGRGSRDGRQAPSSTTGGDAAPLTYLGQGHAAEISRARLARAALRTCREHGATYRPHPSERDVTSRAVLAGYRRAGITVDTSGVPLVDLEAPIVSVFSTGVLEAAARGREAWVDFPRPPAWLGEFWERYAMHRLGSTPHPRPHPTGPPTEPAERIAAIVTGAAS